VPLKNKNKENIPQGHINMELNILATEDDALRIGAGAYSGRLITVTIPNLEV
jgi:hypothetical protein